MKGDDLTGIEIERYERQMGVELSGDKGIVVLEVAPNTPADKSGLRPGDIIVKMDNQDIDSMSQLGKILYKYRKGDKVNLAIIRNGKRLSLEVVFTQLK